jgi:DNA-binding beta-propeller fold protein YncE
MAAVIAVSLLAAACGSSSDNGEGDAAASDAGAAEATQPVAPAAPDSTSSTPPTSAPATSTEAPPAEEVDSADPTTAAPLESGAIGKFPELVYVPASTADKVHVIDPDTFSIIGTYPTGAIPHHVTPSWDLSVLYVLNTGGNSLLVMDPATGQPVNEIPVIDPYNLYFTPDGEDAIVVAERLRRLDIRDPVSWELKAQVSVPWPGVDHMAFSPEGDYLLASTEFSGRLVKINTETWEVAGEPLAVGGEPIDVVRTPDQRLMLVANQGAGFGGVHVIDPDTMTEVKWIPTGAGAHGILLSHDETQVYVSNRLEGSISIVDLATLEVVNRWVIPGGGSPDMGQLNIEGDEFWIAGRFHSEVYVFDTGTGDLKARIPVDSGPHGLTYFPSRPYAHSIGHNGVYWTD